MAALSPHSLVSGGPSERRAAIWPWLVMPLVTLALFFALNRLHQNTPPAASFEAGPDTTASSSAESSTP